MTAPKPKPQECWGLYDASGKLVDLNLFREELVEVRFDEQGLEDALLAGWTIRRVTVTPSDKNGGEG